MKWRSIYLVLFIAPGQPVGNQLPHSQPARIGHRARRIGLGVTNGGGYLGAVGDIAGNGRSQRAAGAVKFTRQPDLGLFAYELPVAPQPVDDGAGILVAAGDEHIFGTVCHELLGAGFKGVGVAAQGAGFH